MSRYRRLFIEGRSLECCHTDIDDAVPGTDGETRVQSLLVFL